jgi:hypothetical protein
MRLPSLRDGVFFNPNPAMNCWATFAVFLRNEAGDNGALPTAIFERSDIAVICGTVHYCSSNPGIRIWFSRAVCMASSYPASA